MEQTQTNISLDVATLLHNIHDALLICDPNGMVLEVSSETSHLLGQPVTSLQNRSIVSFLPHDHRDSVTRFFSPKSRLNRHTVIFPFHRTHKDVLSLKLVLQRSKNFTFCSLRPENEHPTDGHDVHDRYHKFISSSKEGIAIITEGKIEHANKTFLTIYGYRSLAEVKHKQFSSFIAPKDRKNILEFIDALRSGKPAPTRYGYTGVKKDGKPIDVEVISTMIPHKGKLSVLAFHQDITDRKRHEAEFKESGNRLRLLSAAFMNSTDAITIIDLEGNVLYINKAREKLLGHGDIKIIGINGDIHDTQTEQTISRSIVAETVEHGTWTGEVQYQLKNGKTITVLLSTSLISDEKGIPIAVVGSARDITERKHLELELSESERLFHNVVNTMGDAVLLTDLQGAVLDVNKEFELITGYSKKEVLGLPFPYPWLIEEDMPRYVTWISELRTKNYMHDFDMRWITKDRYEVPISLNTTLMRNELGDPVAMLNIARDITERKKLSVALENRTRQIEMLNRIIGHVNVGMMNDDVLQVICNELLTFFSFEHITIVLLDHTRQFLNVYGVIHRVEGVLKRGSRFPLSYSLAKFPIEWMQPVLYNDLDLESEEIKDTIGYRHGVRAFLSVPILFQGNVIGAFSLSSHEKNVFPPSALSILHPIVEQIGLSIEKTRLYTELRNSEEKYRLLVETARDMVFSIDLEGRFRYVSPSAFSLTGYTVEELLDLGVSDKIIYEDDYPRLKALLRLLKHSRDVFTNVKNIESRFIHKDGMTIWVSISWTPIFDEEGYISGVQGILHDITERKTSEQKINKQLNQLNVLYDFSRRITSSLNAREIGELMFRFAERIIPFDAFFIDTYDQTRKMLLPLISVDTVGGKKVMLPGPFDQIKLDPATALFTAIVEKRSVMIDRVDDDSQIFISIHQRPSHHTASLIFVPMFSKERILGGLSIQSSMSEIYTNDHLHLIESIANLAALAIEKATLYEETVMKSFEIHAGTRNLMILLMSFPTI